MMFGVSVLPCCQRLGASRRILACVKPKFEDSPEGLCLTCEAPSRSEGSPKGFPRYGFGLCVRAGFGAQNCQPALDLNRSTKLQVSTSPRLTQNPLLSAVLLSIRISVVDCYFSFPKNFTVFIFSKLFMTIRSPQRLRETRNG